MRGNGFFEGNCETYIASCSHCSRAYLTALCPFQTDESMFDSAACFIFSLMQLNAGRASTVACHRQRDPF